MKNNKLATIPAGMTSLSLPEDFPQAALAPLNHRNFPEDAADVAKTAFARLLNRRARSEEQNEIKQQEIARRETRWQKKEEARYLKECEEYETAMAAFQENKTRFELEAETHYQKSLTAYYEAQKKWREEIDRQMGVERVAMDKYYADPAYAQKIQALEKARNNPETVEEWTIKFILEDMNRDEEEEGWPARVYKKTVATVNYDCRDVKQKAALNIIYQKLITKIEKNFKDEMERLVRGVRIGKPEFSVFGDTNLGYFIMGFITRYRVVGVELYYSEAGKDTYKWYPYHITTVEKALSNDPEYLAGVFLEIMAGSDLKSGISRSEMVELMLPAGPAKPVFDWPVTPCPQEPARPVFRQRPPEKPVKESPPDFEAKVNKKMNRPSGLDTRPFLKRFPNLGSQLTIYMQLMAVRGQVNKVLEENLFGKDTHPMTVQADQYQEASWIKGEKRSIRRRLEEKALPAVQGEVAKLYKLLSFRASAQKRIEILESTGAVATRQNELVLSKEIVEMYGELIESLALDLEICISCPDMELPDIGHIMETVNKLGASGEKILEVLQEAIIQYQASKEAKDL